jgi:hypothetical protein
LIAIIQAAGWPIWPLLVASVVALALVIERFLALRARVVAPAGLVDEVLSITRDALPAQAVVDALAASSVQGRVLAAGLRALASEPRIGPSDLERAFEQAGREALHHLGAHLNALGSIATEARTRSSWPMAYRWRSTTPLSGCSWPSRRCSFTATSAAGSTTTGSRWSPAPSAWPRSCAACSSCAGGQLEVRPGHLFG